MSKDKVKASWDANSTKIFIDLCLEQVKKGSRRNTSFSKDGWKAISDGFTVKTGKIYERGQFKNKYDALRKECQLWDRLLRETGAGWDISNKTIMANPAWWDKKIAEVPGYDKFRARGLQYQEELTQLFSSVAATGTQSWAPSSMSLPVEPIPNEDMEEGSGDSDEVLVSPTGLSGDLNSFSFISNSGGSAGNSGKGKGSSNGDRTTSLLGVRKRGASTKKKGPNSVKIAEALIKMVEANDADVQASRTERIEARDERMAAEARAYEVSIAGVMSHLNQIPEIVNDTDFYARCAQLLMRDPPAREMYAAIKNIKENLLYFLRRECYGNE